MADEADLVIFVGNTTDAYFNLQVRDDGGLQLLSWDATTIYAVFYPDRSTFIGNSVYMSEASSPIRLSYLSVNQRLGSNSVFNLTQIVTLNNGDVIGRVVWCSKTLEGTYFNPHNGPSFVLLDQGFGIWAPENFTDPGELSNQLKWGPQNLALPRSFAVAAAGRPWTGMPIPAGTAPVPGSGLYLLMNIYVSPSTVQTFKAADFVQSYYSLEQGNCLSMGDYVGYCLELSDEDMASYNSFTVEGVDCTSEIRINIFTEDTCTEDVKFKSFPILGTDTIDGDTRCTFQCYNA